MVISAEFGFEAAATELFGLDNFTHVHVGFFADPSLIQQWTYS